MVTWCDVFVYVINLSINILFHEKRDVGEGKKVSFAQCNMELFWAKLLFTWHKDCTIENIKKDAIAKFFMNEIWRRFSHRSLSFLYLFYSNMYTEEKSTICFKLAKVAWISSSRLSGIVASITSVFFGFSANGCTNPVVF